MEASQLINVGKATALAGFYLCTKEKKNKKEMVGTPHLYAKSRGISRCSSQSAEGNAVNRSPKIYELDTDDTSILR